LTAPYFVHTIKPVEITFDPAKNARNIRDRGLSFESVVDFDFETAIFDIDERRDYGETRYRALGLLGGRVHALVYVATAVGIRVISLRRANMREVRRYEAQTES
jgi:uncharacterized protein